MTGHKTSQSTPLTTLDVASRLGDAPTALVQRFFATTRQVTEAPAVAPLPADAPWPKSYDDGTNCDWPTTARAARFGQEWGRSGGDGERLGAGPRDQEAE